MAKRIRVSLSGGSRAGLTFPVGRPTIPPKAYDDGYVSGLHGDFTDKLKLAAKPNRESLVRAGGSVVGILAFRRMLNTGPMSDWLQRGFVTMGGSVVGLGVVDSAANRNDEPWSTRNIIESGGLAGGLLVHDVILQRRRARGDQTTRRRAVVEQLLLMATGQAVAKTVNIMRGDYEAPRASWRDVQRDMW